MVVKEKTEESADLQQANLAILECDGPAKPHSAVAIKKAAIPGGHIRFFEHWPTSSTRCLYPATTALYQGSPLLQACFSHGDGAKDSPPLVHGLIPFVLSH